MGSDPKVFDPLTQHGKHLRRCVDSLTVTAAAPSTFGDPVAFVGGLKSSEARHLLSIYLSADEALLLITWNFD